MPRDAKDLRSNEPALEPTPEPTSVDGTLDHLDTPAPTTHRDPARLVKAAKPKHYGALHELFRRLAHRTAYLIGTPIAFGLAMATILVWAMTGPLFHYSDTWQLIINTGTTVVTFLVVFMIQNTQNRDSQAIHLKLDELIRSMKTARNAMVNIEDLPDAEIARLQEEMRTICVQRSSDGEDSPGRCAMCGHVGEHDDDDHDNDHDGEHLASTGALGRSTRGGRAREPMS